MKPTNRTKLEITKGSTELTAEEIRTIIIARVAASQEVDSLLAIIDRITETKWELGDEI